MWLRASFASGPGRPGAWGIPQSPFVPAPEHAARAESSWHDGTDRSKRTQRPAEAAQQLALAVAALKTEKFLFHIHEPIAELAPGRA
jgi:hypothetical protein